MGYTHYWYRPIELDKVRFYKLAADVALLMDHLPKHSTSGGGYYRNFHLHIRGPYGTGNPIIQPDGIQFNGDKKQKRKADWHDGYEIMMHHMFKMERIYKPHPREKPYENENYGDFCKTERKPYDLLVCATLLRFHYHFPEGHVSSDGSKLDWENARAWCEEIFGEVSLDGIEFYSGVE